MDEISFTIVGNPKAQKRHRTYTKGKGGRPLPFARNVDPSKEDKADMLAQIMQYRPDAPWTGPVQVIVSWVFTRPKNHFRTGKHAGKLRSDAPICCDKKPDIDNLEKALLDALNGVFWLDDAQVAGVVKTKTYSDLPERPRTEVTLRKLERARKDQCET